MKVLGSIDLETRKNRVDFLGMLFLHICNAWNSATLLLFTRCEH